MKKYRNYTDEQIIEYAKTAEGMAGLLRKLDLKPLGSNYYTMKRKIQRLKVDTSHWSGQAWNRGKRTQDWSDFSRANNAKPHLIKERGNICECCKNTHWLEKEIKLEIHHEDGDRTNNCKENLKLLCPNCHSFTDRLSVRAKEYLTICVK
jgi:hypothetical protein